MAGPAINTASMLVINKALGKKQTVIYIVSIVLGAISFGLVMDYLLPSSWFDVSHMNAAVACCEEGHNEWFSIICSVVFLILLIKSFFHGHHHHGECGCGCHDGGCHCHDHDDEGHCHCHEDDDDDDCCCCGENSEVVLKVKGMCCSHCANNLRDAFLANDEIDSCEVDHNSGLVNIKFKEGKKMTKEQLAAVVDGLGYEVVDE